MPNSYHILLIFMVLLLGCKTPEARKPIKVASGSRINTSVELNKKWVAEEDLEIKTYIEKDSLHQYINSEQGFWYYYNTQIAEITEKTDFGDLVEFEYDVKDLYGTTLYSKEELGLQKYRIDKEELITGLREGLKIMKEGETVTFIFPSYKAYGYYGDQNKIGTYMPIKSTVTILNIEHFN